MYVTYGSKDLNPDPGPLPPQQRFFSDRVWYVRQLAKDAGQEFALITAEYGLVFEQNFIPPDNSIVDMDKVESLGKETAKVLKTHGAKDVVFFIIPEEWGEGGAADRFNLVLQYACNLAKIPYTMKPIKVPLGQRTKGEPTPVRPENIPPFAAPLGGPYSMNKKAEPAVYELLAQDENGIWKSVRKSSFLPDLQIKAKSLLEEFPNRKVSIKAALDFETEYFS
jgi:hypothetical protein